MTTPVAKTIAKVPDLEKELENIKTFEILPTKKVMQPNIKKEHRSIVVDWLFELSNEWNLFDDTIHYAVSYMDRYLFEIKERLEKLQLVGATCLWIACKFNEVYPPDVEDFVYMTDDTFTRKDFLKKEADVLSAINFELSKPTTKTFLMHYSNDDINHQVDLSLMVPPECLPSKQAQDILKKRKRFENPSHVNRGIGRKYAKLDAMTKLDAMSL